MANCASGFAMDGQLSETAWTSTGAWQNITYVSAGTLGLGASAKFKTYFDNTNLYVGVQVTKSPATLYSNATLYLGDAVELFFDMGHNKSATYDANDTQFTFGYGNPTPQVAGAGSLSGVNSTYFNTGTGWSAEIAIPWTSLGVSTPGAGTVYGFDASVDVASASGTRQCQLTWANSSTTIFDYQNTSLFGDLTIGAACPFMSPTRTPTNSPFTATPTPTRTNVAVGASTPYTEFEAESAQLVGAALLGATRTVGQAANEASGRQAVQLNSLGNYVKFSPGMAFNSIVVRYAIPDGADQTVSLYINDVFQQKLTLTSKYSYAYIGGGWPTGTINGYAQSGSTPVHWYDEVHALIGEWPAGTTVRLQKDTGDNAAWYIIDFIDLEEVAPALTMPGGAFSVATYGAVGNGTNDDTTAIRNAITAAGTGGTVWLPTGTYKITSPIAIGASCTIKGAGMWYSTIHQANDAAGFNCNFSGALNFSNFAIFGEVADRFDGSADCALNGHGGNGSTLQNIWIEHFKCGWWVGNDITTGSTTNNLNITGCRIRDLWADGVNFCNGSSNCTVQQSSIRNSGDDGLASWSPSSNGSNTNNIFKFNNVQMPWRANGIAIYGGSSCQVTDNVVTDTSNYPGIMVAQEFTSTTLSNPSVLRNNIYRCGGTFGGTNNGALKISTQQGAVGGITFGHNTIVSSTFAGIFIAGGNPVNSATFTFNTITSPLTYGIESAGGTGGTINADNVVVTGPGTAGLLNNGGINFVRGAGNSGW